MRGAGGAPMSAVGTYEKAEASAAAACGGGGGNVPATPPPYAESLEDRSPASLTPDATLSPNSADSTVTSPDTSLDLPRLHSAGSHQRSPEKSVSGGLSASKIRAKPTLQRGASTSSVPMPTGTGRSVAEKTTASQMARVASVRESRKSLSEGRHSLFIDRHASNHLRESQGSLARMKHHSAGNGGLRESTPSLSANAAKAHGKIPGMQRRSVTSLNTGHSKAPACLASYRNIQRHASTETTGFDDQYKATLSAVPDLERSNEALRSQLAAAAAEIKELASAKAALEREQVALVDELHEQQMRNEELQGNMDALQVHRESKNVASKVMLDIAEKYASASLAKEALAEANVRIREELDNSRASSELSVRELQNLRAAQDGLAETARRTEAQLGLQRKELQAARQSEAHLQTTLKLTMAQRDKDIALLQQQVEADAERHAGRIAELQELLAEADGRASAASLAASETAGKLAATEADLEQARRHAEEQDDVRRDLQGRLADAEAQLEAVQAAAEEKMSSVRATMEREAGRVEVLTQQLTEKSAALDAANIKVVELSAELATARGDAEAAGVKLSEVSRLQGQIFSLEKQLADEEQAHTTFRQEAAEKLEAAILEMNEKVAAAQSEAHEAKAGHAATTQELNVLQKVHDSNVAGAEVLRSQLNDARAETSRQATEIGALTSKLDTEMTVATAARIRGDELEGKLASSLSAAEGERRRAEAAEAEAASARAELARARADVDAARADVDGSRTDAAELAAELAAVRCDAGALRARVADVTDDLVGARSQAASATAEAEAAKQRAGELAAEIASRDANLADLRASLADLREELEASRKGASESVHREAELDGALKAATEGMGELLATSKGLQARLEAEQQRSEAFCSKVVAFEATSSALEDEVERLNGQLAAQLDKLGSQQDRAALMQEEIDHLTGELSRLGEEQACQRLEAEEAAEQSKRSHQHDAGPGAKVAGALGRGAAFLLAAGAASLATHKHLATAGGPQGAPAGVRVARPQATRAKKR